MQVMTRAVDQWMLIGEDIVVSPTDIDSTTVRLVARGRLLGGPNDGATFQSIHELSRGQSFAVGACVAVSLLDIVGGEVRLGVNAPPHITISRKEQAEQQKHRKRSRRKRDDQQSGEAA